MNTPTQTKNAFRSIRSEVSITPRLAGLSLFSNRPWSLSDRLQATVKTFSSPSLWHPAAYLSRTLWRGGVARRHARGFIDPCIPTLATKPPAGRPVVHEIKHDGYRLIARRHGRSCATVHPAWIRLDRALSADPQGDGRPGARRDHGWRGGGVQRSRHCGFCCTAGSMTAARFSAPSTCWNSMASIYGRSRLNSAKMNCGICCSATVPESTLVSMAFFRQRGTCAARCSRLHAQPPRGGRSRTD